MSILIELSGALERALTLMLPYHIDTKTRQPSTDVSGVVESAITMYLSWLAANAPDPELASALNAEAELYNKSKIEECRIANDDYARLQ